MQNFGLRKLWWGKITDKASTYSLLLAYFGWFRQSSQIINKSSQDPQFWVNKAGTGAEWEEIHIFATFFPTSEPWVGWVGEPLRPPSQGLALVTGLQVE